jgi:flagellar M-ring protein FliF
MERLRQLLNRARAYYGSLPAQRRATLVVTVALAFAITAAIWGYAAYDPMTLLFDRPMDAKTSASVLDWLEQNGMDHRIEPGTSRIYVPRSQRDRVAMELRGSSMISGTGGGLELLDNAPIGSTQFMERRRWTMALQREIEAQITGFDQVLASKVLLSLPEEALFAEDQVDPSASVYVELKTGMSLSTDEGGRVASLVAAAVPRLRPDRVEILDSELRVIHSMRDSEEEYGLSSELAELRRQHDRYYTAKVERILERIVGPGKVVAQVSVELDHNQTTIQQRELDGEGAVVIAQRSRESTSVGAAAGGVPGTTANTPELEQPSRTSGREAAEADEVANIDVPDTRTHTASLPGGILSMTASVVVDGTWETPAATEAAEGAEAAEAAEPTYTARTEQELTEFSRIVAGAIGVPVEAVTVVNRPFARIDMTPEQSPTAAPVDWPQYLPWGAVALALVLSFLFVVRPAMKGLVDHAVEQAADGANAQLGGADAAGALAAPDETPEQALAEWLENVAAGDSFITRDEVNRLVSADIVHSVVTLQTWIAREIVE